MLPAHKHQRGLPQHYLPALSARTMLESKHPTLTAINKECSCGLPPPCSGSANKHDVGFCMMFIGTGTVKPQAWGALRKELATAVVRAGKQIICCALNALAPALPVFCTACDRPLGVQQRPYSSISSAAKAEYTSSAVGSFSCSSSHSMVFVRLALAG